MADPGRLEAETVRWMEQLLCYWSGAIIYKVVLCILEFNRPRRQFCLFYGMCLCVSLCDISVLYLVVEVRVARSGGLSPDSPTCSGLGHPCCDFSPTWS